MSFAVKPSALDSASGAFGELREVMSELCLHTIGPMQPGTGGFMINGFAEEIGKIRDKLMDQYSFDGPARTTFINAAQEFRGLAYDYREADANAAAASDAILTKVDAPDMDFSTSDWSGIKSDGDTYISVSNYGDLLATAESSLTDYGQWKEITGKVSEIAGMGYLTDWLPNFGWEDPIPRIIEMVDGDWEQLGLSIGAIEVAGSAWSRLGEDIAGIWEVLSENWSGNAADAAFAWLGKLHQAALDHGDSLRMQAEHLHRLAQSTLYEVDGIITALTFLGDLIPQPLDLGWWVDHILPNKVAGDIIKYIGHIDAILALCGEPFKFFENIGYDESEVDLELPTLGYTAPEVPHD